MQGLKNGKKVNMYEVYDENNDDTGLKLNAGKVIEPEKVLTQLTKSQREKLISGYDIKKFAKIFEDEGMMQTAMAFLDNDMNVSKTARKLYMHRNTLMYKLNAIERLTGLDLRNFGMAVTFKVLHTLYILK